jgi:FkbM family methyltransferase
MINTLKKIARKILKTPPIAKEMILPVYKFIPKEEYQRVNKLPRYTLSESELLGRKMSIPDSTTFLGSLIEIFVEEIYKFEPSATKPITIIDCGANIGLASIYFAQRFPQASIKAYEADPNIYVSMKANFDSFEYTKVEAINAAVSNKNGEIFFHLEGGHSGMIADSAAQNSVAVPCVRLKDVLDQYDDITFLKIDIEGHESEVLPDIAEELKKVQFLFLEYHSFVDQPQVLDKLLSIITGAGLKYYIREAYNKPFPFITREIFFKMDLLVNIFCYRD